MSASAPLEPEKVSFRFSRLNDWYREFGFPNGSNGVRDFYDSTWPNADAHFFRLEAR